MDLSFVTKYTVLVVLGICLCVGYIIKNLIPNDKINKYIPLIMGILGLTLNIWISGNINADVVLAGLFSGLASTGLFETFKNIIKKPDGTLIVDKSNPEKDIYKFEVGDLDALDQKKHLTLKVEKR